MSEFHRQPTSNRSPGEGEVRQSLGRVRQYFVSVYRELLLCSRRYHENGIRQPTFGGSEKAPYVVMHSAHQLTHNCRNSSE